MGSTGFTSPGRALELDSTPIAAINAAPATGVPIPPPPIVPASLTPDEGQADTVAADLANSDADFDSLSEAVAAQVVPDDMDAELKCLAIGVYFESKGEPLAGQLAVADVILNRSRSARFPRSVCSVLTQPSQFSFVRGGRLPHVRAGTHAWKTAVAVARVARRNLWDSPVPDALFFHASYVKPHWRLAKVGTVGKHIFYR